MSDIVSKKKLNSTQRLTQLSQSLCNSSELAQLPSLAIFAAGSYARKEASIHSDIDLFFIYDGQISNVPNPNLKAMRAFSKIIEVADSMRFPTLSNDGEFLKILDTDSMKKELGGRNDDYLNYFTARMLMLLESHPIYGQDTYDAILDDIIGSYFRDYTHHPESFRPIFLINDIIRFWKTLCLNYENKRNQPENDPDRKIKQKIKNFKLKFSRMLTCYGSIAAIIEKRDRAEPKAIAASVKLSPLERIQSLEYTSRTFDANRTLLRRNYEWFLEVTDVSEEELTQKFRKKEFRTTAFQKADIFGEAMYAIVHEVSESTGYTRYLVI